MSATLPGLRILVVEDEMMVIMLIEDALTEAGCDILVAARVQEAIRLAEVENIDCALLDVSIAGEDVYPVAEVLDRRNIPFILSTGYDKASLPLKYQDRPLLPKPYSPEDVPQIVAATLGLWKDRLRPGSAGFPL